MRRILIVDDDAIVRDTMVALLSFYGFSVSVAASGEEAVDQVRRSGFDGIVMDINMPGIDGLTACRQLREAGVATPIIALTGMPNSPQTRELREKYGVTVMVKPPDVDALVAHIRTLHNDEIRDAE